MELKPGYKQTEVGVIPEDWAERSLFDLADRRKELFDDGDWIEAEYLTDGGIRLVQTGNIGEGHFTDKESKRYISAESFTKLGCKDLKVGDILICRLAEPAGRACILPDIGEERVITAVDVTIFRPPSSTADRRYLVNSFNTRRWFQSVNERCGGTTRTRIARGELGKIKIPLPPLPEQRAIATALSDVDALIGALDRLIAKKRDLKQAAMQQLLTGQTRLPGFSGAWEVKRLGDVCRITTGKKDVNEGNPEGLFPFFTCSRMHTFSDFYSFDEEAIMIAGNGDVGNLHYYKGKFEAYQRTYVLFDFSMNVSYLWHQLNAHLVNSLGIGKIGSSIPYIKMENLVEFEFKNPINSDEQTAIASVLSDMDAEIAALEARRDKTRLLKQGMMQELLTGKTRLI